MKKTPGQIAEILQMWAEFPTASLRDGSCLIAKIDTKAKLAEFCLWYESARERKPAPA